METLKNSAEKNKMGTQPILKLIFTMSLPTMFSMFVQAMYNVVDSIFVAKVGEEALTAVSLAFPLQMLIIAVGVGVGVGVNSLISRLLGQEEHKMANEVAAHALLIALASYILFFLMGLFLIKPFFAMYASESPLVYAYGVDYGSVVLIYSFGFFGEVVVEKMLQATGNMIFPMLFQLTGAVTNIILDPLLIFGIGPFPKLGVKGAAVATVIGQILSMIFAFIVLFAMKNKIKVSYRGFKFKPFYIKNILAVGFPAMIMQSIASFMVLLLNAILITFSEAAVSVLGIYYKLQSFVFMPVFGLNQGVLPIFGFNYGAGNRRRLNQAYRYAVIIASVIMAIGTVIFIAAPDKLIALFLNGENDGQILKIGVTALRIIAMSFIPAGISIISSTVFQAVGKGFTSLFISVLRQLVLILPLAFAFSKIGLDYVWLSFPIAEVFSLATTIILIIRLNKTTLSRLPN